MSADTPKPDHAPAPKMELRPDGATARAVDRQAFEGKQQALRDHAGRSAPAQKSNEQSMFRASTAAARDRAFYGEPQFDKEKGALTKEFNSKSQAGQER